MMMHGECSRHVVVQLLLEPECLALRKDKGGLRIGVCASRDARIRGVKNNKTDAGAVKRIVQRFAISYVERIMI